MKILFVEDRGVVLYDLIGKIEGLGHEVLLAFNVAQARAVWNGGSSEVACIIVDLNIPADIRAKVAIDSKNSKSVNKEWDALAGWIWLDQEGLAGKKATQTKDAPKIVIYTAYLDVWRAQGYRESDCPNVKFFPKVRGSTDNLLHYLNSITAA